MGAGDENDITFDEQVKSVAEYTESRIPEKKNVARERETFYVCIFEYLGRTSGGSVDSGDGASALTLDVYQ